MADVKKIIIFRPAENPNPGYVFCGPVLVKDSRMSMKDTALVLENVTAYNLMTVDNLNELTEFQFNTDHNQRIIPKDEEKFKNRRLGILVNHTVPQGVQYADQDNVIQIKNYITSLSSDLDVNVNIKETDIAAAIME